MKHILVFLFIISISGCSTTINVEYPVFSNTKEGRQLKSFIVNRRNVAIIVEPPNQNAWSQISKDSSFIDQIPASVFDKLNREGYYKLIDATKNADLMNEIANSLSGLTKKRLQLGKQLAADMFLYIGYQNPVTSCSTVIKEIKEYYNDAEGKQRSRKKMVPTGYRVLLIPLAATLIITESGATMTAVSAHSYKKESDAGNPSCPEPLLMFHDALNIAADEILERLSPKVKTERISIIKSDENPEVNLLLKEGYEEASGETPSLERAFQVWLKAEKVSGYKSEGAIANIGAYYFAIGDFDNAIKYFDKASELNGGKKKRKYRELRKKVQAVKSTDNN